jgi:large subunit ribosomal protein L6
MSRLGKVPVAVPSGVKIASEKGTFTVSGPQGSLRFRLHSALSLEVAGPIAKVLRADDSREAKAHHGLTRAMLANMVRGVTQGYEKRLEVVGVGWGARIEGKDVALTIGYCHPVKLPIPQGVTVECPSQNLVIIRGTDRQIVGELAARIRRVRPPEPYNGKGIKYSDEVIRRKQGKSFGTT